MKLLVKLTLLLGCSIFFTGLFGQEIRHAHSVHHGFVENKGQWDQNVLFKSRFPGGNLWVEQNKLMFHLQDYSKLQYAHSNPSKPIDNTDFEEHIVNVNFVHSNKITSVEKATPYKHYYNFFIGNDKSKWQSDVKSYPEATLKDLYPGIDLKIIEEPEQLKYEFHIAPNADPSQIILDITGQKDLSIDKEGQLVIDTRLGKVIENKPYTYQIVNGKIKEIPNKFKISNSQVTFELGAYNKNLPLIIDPVLIFATYSGSVTDNFGMTATYANDGSAISGGTIYGNSYPTPDPNAYDVSSNFTVANVGNSVCTDIFVSKYATDGTQMLWTTFFGGGNNNQGTETVHSLICDKQDNVFLFGATSSADIPIVNGFQSVHGGGNALNISYNGTNFHNQGIDIYVAKFSSNGHQLLGSTYIGGSGNDGLSYTVTGASSNYGSASAYDSITVNYGDQFRGEIMLDENENCLIASSTRSSNFPTVNPIQAAKSGGQDGVIIKLSNDLSTLLFSTYFGGSQNDACYSIKVDSSQNILVSGATSSPNLPATSGAWQTSYNGGKTDGFVLKMPPALDHISALSYIGTSNLDQAFFVEIDRSDNVFLLGVSQGGQFPVINSTYSNANSGQFIMKLNSSLSVVEHSTIFGNGNGKINISPAAFLVDFCGNIYVSGWGANILQSSPLNGMPVTSNAFQGTPANGFDFYLTVFNRNFSTQLYGTYLGGANAQEHVDGGTSRFDKNGVIYQSVCGGCGGYSDFPTSPNAWSNNNLSSNCNNIVFKFDFEITPKAEFTADQTTGCAPLTITFDNHSSSSDHYVWDFGNGNLDSTTFNPVKTFGTPGTYQVYLYVTDSICEVTDTAMITINILDSLLSDVQDLITLCKPAPISVPANSYGLGTSWHWSSNKQFTDQLNSSPSDSVLNVTPAQDGFYYVRISNPYCSIIDSVEVKFLSTSIDLTGKTTICLHDTTHIFAVSQNPQIQLTYSWEPASAIESQVSGNHIIVSPDTSMYIYVTATTNDGCIHKDSIWIDVNMFPQTTVTASASETHVFNGESVTLTAEPPGYSYTWTPATNVVSPNSRTTEAKINGTTIFKVTVSDGGFCPKSDTVIVFGQEYVCDNPFVYLPNAFTPNGDGENDILYVRSALTQKVVLRIFNRWGQMVFETTDQHIGWDGTFKERPCDPDVYDYYLQVICIDQQEKIIKGNVTLIR
ncbi:MAG: hypothetical protein BGO87_15170 [Flavobacteriia bacterium 40-80]|uniref:DUF7948 domain-containing protein n=1 Tax=uncultured Flavobacterium sp. TaxID=165435 RepID=UPI00095C6607|nr:T9SS type B sorting domain-containing protein [uncultured Flavobacterium sp.]OJX37102.1 MAG: hypothetical protein BGO87_15170 [Flavobacteriia bacterium 40-80]